MRRSQRAELSIAHEAQKKLSREQIHPFLISWHFPAFCATDFNPTSLSRACLSPSTGGVAPLHFYEAWLLQGALQLQPRELLPGSGNARLSPVQRFQRW